jgi:transketolase
MAIENLGKPSVLIFTRQNLPHQARDQAQIDAIARGGYILREAKGKLDCILIATGSEVGLAIASADELQAEGIGVRVVSMPNPGLFLRQDSIYREIVLPPSQRARVAVEAGVSDCWYRFVGDRGEIVGVNRFGASAPAKDLFKYFGLTAERVVLAARKSMAAALSM